MNDLVQRLDHDAIAAELRRLGYVQFVIELDRQGGFEATYRTAHSLDVYQSISAALASMESGEPKA